MVVVLVAGALLLVLGQAPAPAPSKAASFVLVGDNTINSSQKLELRLSVNATYSGGQAGNVTVHIKLDEFNTLQDTYNDVLASSSWSLNGLELGSCGNGVYPFGVALYSGDYTVGNSTVAANVTEATPLQIYPSVSCPQATRLVTGYVFNPGSNLAVVLPNTTNSSAIQIGSNLTATAVYTGGHSPTILGPGTYTVAAGDEWGSVVTVNFTLGRATSSSSAAADPQLAVMSLVLSMLPASVVLPGRGGRRPFRV